MSKRKDNYSVFVGHLSQSTKKEDLTGLFSKCGKIVEIFTLKSEDQNYAYGFVRYAKKDSALQAVQELDKWQMNGLPMIVDLSRETKDRIEEEDELEGRGTSMSKTPPENQDRYKKCDNSRGYIEDVINLSRLQECCHQINARTMQSGNKQKINGDRLLNDVSEMSYNAAPNVSSGLIDYDAVELRNLTKKLLSHSYGCTEQGLSEKDTKDFFLALEVMMDTIKSFTAFCNHGVKPEVLRQAEEVKINQKVQNEQNVLQNLKPLGNNIDSSIHKKNDGNETNIVKSEDKNNKEVSGDKLPGNQDIRHCNPQTYIKSTDEYISDLKIKEKNLKDLLSVGKRSTNDNGEKNVAYDHLTKNDVDPNVTTLKSHNMLMNTDSDSDDCELIMKNSPENITSLKNITNKTISQEENNSQKAYCTTVQNNSDISSLKQLKESRSDAESSKKQNIKKGFLGSAPVNILPVTLHGGDGLLGAVPKKKQATLRNLNYGLNDTLYSTKPGCLGSAPSGPQYQAPKGHSFASINSISKTSKPSHISQACSKNQTSWKPDTCDKTLPTYTTKPTMAEKTLPRSLTQLSPSPRGNCNFSFGRGRGFLFKS
ncbi:hypothetical protein LOTGIDRAFT_228554 [Lottia gigantea]|uniref:RRM domain-containing protein n=1 Tax=Lottia gigantea TaxID=225164 RepID=V3ZQT0_LOTGI|nr:hypothetical protein LOTGIDRAFT_228554 [Lottia gigantea]ESO93778.1 hypothetical protein LOTGIDRAFT_228554 [Lottia gigantea]